MENNQRRAMFARMKGQRLYAVQGDTLDGKNQWLTTAVSLQEAKNAAKNLKRDMRIAIPKYHWVRNIRIIKNVKIVPR